MSLWNSLTQWLVRVTGRDRFESEMRAELEFHIQARAEELLRRGAPRREALRRARAEFGAVERYKEEGRQMSAYRFLDNLRADVRDAWRGLRRDPSFTVPAVSIVAAMLAANMALFAFLDAFFLRRLPIAGAERHFEFSIQDEQGRIKRRWPLSNVERFLANNSNVLEASYVFAERRVNVGGAEPKRSYVEVVSPSYFKLLRPRLATGRTPGSDPFGSREQAILLSHSGWQRLTNADADIIGRSLLVNGTSLAVSGILAEGAGGLEPVTPDFWMLAGAADQKTGEGEYSISGVLREGISVEQASAALGSAADALDSGVSQGETRRVLIQLRPNILRESRELQPLALSILFLFGLVTLVTGANLTNLHLARAAARRRDLAIRVALGATRGRLIWHIVTESVFVAGIAGMAAWAMAHASVARLQGLVFSLVSDAGMSMRPIAVDGRIGAAGMVLAALVGLGCGLAPALHTTRGALAGALQRDGFWLAGRVSAGRLRGTLVALQVALSFPLLVGAGILVRTAMNANRADVGYDIDRLIDLRADPPSARLYARLREIPGVTSVSAAAHTPLTGPMPQTSARVEGTVVRVGINRVDERYFDTVGFGVTMGRSFLPNEAANRAPAVVISESTARRLFPDGSPLGRTIELENIGVAGEFRSHEIIGVSADVLHGLFIQGRERNEVYAPSSFEAGGLAELLVRLERGDAAELGRLRSACADFGAYCEPFVLRSVLNQQRVPFVVGSQVASSLGLLALGLACLGLYGLASFSVVQRTREIGVRIALGATRAQILRNVLAESARRSGAGLAFGLPFTLTLSALLAAKVPFAKPFDVVAYFFVPAMLLGCTLLASLAPALRAAAIDPIRAIRED